MIAINYYLHSVFEMREKNIFTWENGLHDFLNPKNIITPIVELPPKMNPYYQDGVRIFAKLLNTLPLNNVKSIPAFTMLNDTKTDLSKIHTITENSSGNTVLSLAVIGKLFGIETTKAFVSNEVTIGKLKLLRLFWVVPMVNREPICPDPNDKTSGIYKAIKLWKKNWRYNPWQYHNENNPKAHYEITWPQIYDQLDGNIQLFCAGLGTTGTMTGISTFLKEKDKKIYSLGVIRKPNNPIPWPRTRSLLQQIAFDWKSCVDKTIEVGAKESYIRSLDLIRNGIVVWPSSWFALQWLFEFLEKQKSSNGLDALRNNQWEIHAVFICCDSPYSYIDEYFTYLDDNYFPQIENENILLNKDYIIKKKNSNEMNEYFITSEELFDKAIKWTRQEIEKKLENSLPIELNKGWILFDIRNEEEFFHFHIPWSQYVLEKDIHSEAISKKNKKLVIICRYWVKSIDIVNILRREWYDETYSLEWGITERSNKLLPRWKPVICFKKQPL